MPFLPVTPGEQDMTPDFVFVTGDAYVDHPSFGTASFRACWKRRGTVSR